MYLTSNFTGSITQLFISKMQKGNNGSNNGNPFASVIPATNKCPVKIAGKIIKDFCTSAITSKLFTLTLLDNEGKLYRSKVDVAIKRQHNFIDYYLPVPNIPNTDQITSIICQFNYIIGCTNTGKLLVISVN